MTEVAARCIREQPRFQGIKKFEKKVLLSSPMMHLGEIEYVKKIFASGEKASRLEKVSERNANRLKVSDRLNICKLEEEIADYIGVRYAVALNSETAAIHLALKLAAEKLYGSASGISTPDGLGKGGALFRRRVFCPDFASASTVNPVVYEGGEPVFIDASPEDWCMDPEVLAAAFDRYPDVKIVMMSHIYGFPGQIFKVREICRKKGAVLIEDASEGLGATVAGKRAGSIGDYGVLSFGLDKIITGGCGGMLLTDDIYSAKKAKYWASQAQTKAPWGQYEELGYNYAMSDITAAVIRGQLHYLSEHITRKKEIYERYLDNLNEDVIFLNPVGDDTQPNYLLSCMTSESNIAFGETRSGRDYTYTDQHGTAAPMEIYDALQAFGVQSSPVYKPMHMQPVFYNCDQITLDGCLRAYQEFDQDDFWVRCDEGKRIFERGLCLPSDIGMTNEEQDRVIEIVNACFCERMMERGRWVAEI